METQPAVSEEKRRSGVAKLGLKLRGSGILQVLIGGGALVFIIANSDASRLIDAIKSTRMAYLPLTIVATIMVYWFMAFRWSVVLEVGGYSIPTARLFRYNLIGCFFGNFVPGGAAIGDVSRLIYLDRDISSKSFALSTIAFEKLIGLFTVLFIGFGSTLASNALLPESRLIYLGEAVLALGFLASAALLSNSLSSLAARLIRAVGVRLSIKRIGDAAARTLEAMSELRKHRTMVLKTVALSVLVRVIWSLSFYIVSLAMGLGVGLWQIFAVTSIVDLIRMLPVTINGIGLREWALIGLFANIGVAREKALMFSFLAFAPLIIVALAGGVVYLTRVKRAKPL